MPDPLRFIAPIPPLRGDARRGFRMSVDWKRWDSTLSRFRTTSRMDSSGASRGYGIRRGKYLAIARPFTRRTERAAPPGVTCQRHRDDRRAVRRTGRTGDRTRLAGRRLHSAGCDAGAGSHQGRKVGGGARGDPSFLHNGDRAVRGRLLPRQRDASAPYMRAAAKPTDIGGRGRPANAYLAGRTADIVGIHAAMDGNRIDRATVTDLTAASIEAKIQRVRAAAADVGRPTPRLQFSCYHVRVTDAPERSVQRSSWAADVEAETELVKDSPAVL